MKQGSSARGKQHIWVGGQNGPSTCQIPFPYVFLQLQLGMRQGVWERNQSLLISPGRSTSKKKNRCPLLPSFLSLLLILLTLTPQNTIFLLLLFYNTLGVIFGIESKFICLLNTLKYRKSLLGRCKLRAFLML